MRGKMYKLTGTGLFGKTPKSKFQANTPPVMPKRKDKISDHKPQTDSLPIPLPNKLRGK